MSGELVVALDIGGTNSRAEVVDEDMHVLTAGWLPTPEADGAATLDRIEGLCRMMLEQLEAAYRPRVRAIGVGVPGVVAGGSGVVRVAGNLGWRNTPVGPILSERLGLPTLVHHDVTVAGLAERTLGAGVGVRDLLAVFLGTGIAASIVVNGEVVQGGLHQAGELGHVPIRPDGLVCACGQRGCLEMYASARAIGAAYSAATGQDGLTSLDVVEQLGADPRADAVWADAVDALAYGLLGAITLLSPERIVVGGGLAQAGELLLAPLRSRLTELARVATVPEIVPAHLGQRAGIIGAGLATFARLGELRPDAHASRAR